MADRFKKCTNHLKIEPLSVQNYLPLLRELFFQARCRMPPVVIYVKVLGFGKNPLTVRLDDSDRILNIKEKLSQQLFVPAEEQNLIFNGKTLENERTLSSENLKDGCLLHLLLIKTHLQFDFTSRLNKFLDNSLPTDNKSMLIAEHCVKYVCDYIDSLSLDEIERYAKQKCLSLESPAGSSNSNP
uniref:Ubiquitin-like domain-containing protein n=1 Tax=Trichuris muris TaxID=70415 RepID=A0A5S6R5I2_TRIMR